MFCKTYTKTLWFYRCLVGPGGQRWKRSGCTNGPFERLPIFPRANEQGKHNEVCLVVLWAEQVGEREGKLGVYKCSSLARVSDACATRIASDTSFEKRFDWPSWASRTTEVWLASSLEIYAQLEMNQQAHGEQASLNRVAFFKSSWKKNSYSFGSVRHL